jgi:hypothetical protein
MLWVDVAVLPGLDPRAHGHPGGGCRAWRAEAVLRRLHGGC